ncbi:MAG TPA: undecaprenyl-phosphate glucose phosphotransferase [Phycisphaerae bacterium]|nr:undecaprenyl-phosphate glucose phosphotransferase [Phycisphaerae bacterium]
MLKQHSQVISFLMGLCDLLVLAAAWGLAYTIRFRFFPYDDLPSGRSVAINLVVTQLVSLVVLAGSGLYKPRRDKSFLIELGQIIKASIIIWVLLIVFIYYTSNTPFTRGMLALVLPFTMAGLILERGAYRSVLRKIRRRGWNLRHALIVGTGRLAQSTLLRLRHNSWTGIRVAGFIDTFSPNTPAPDENTHPIRGVPIVGTTATLIETIDRMKVDCVFLALPTQQNELLRKLTSDLEETSVDIRIIPDLFLSRFPTNVAVDELDGLPILSLRENPLAGWPSIYKRAFDIFGALFGLALFSLPMLAIAIAIKLHDRGPIFYKQCRISYGRRSFNMLKFRTMILNSEPDGPIFADKNDPRCTPLGKHLRAFSLDELPQLFNVLLGDMSLVGPRPERPEMLDKIKHQVPGFPLRLKVRAGITGWAQINGFRGQTSFRKRLQYDLYYLNNWSPLFDLRIVLATLVRGFKHPNAF